MAVTKIEIRKSTVSLQKDGKYILQTVWALIQTAGGHFAGKCAVALKDETAGEEITKTETESGSFCEIPDLEFDPTHSYAMTVSVAEEGKSIISKPAAVHCETVSSLTCEVIEGGIRCAWSQLPMAATYLKVREEFGEYQKTLVLQNQIFGAVLPLDRAGIPTGTKGKFTVVLYFSGEDGEEPVISGPEVISPDIYPWEVQIRGLSEAGWQEDSLRVKAKIALPYGSESAPVRLAVMEEGRIRAVSGEKSLSGDNAEEEFLFEGLKKVTGPMEKLLLAAVIDGGGSVNRMTLQQYFAPAGRLRFLEKKWEKGGTRIRFSGEYPKQPVGYLVSCGQKSWVTEEESILLEGLTGEEKKQPVIVTPRFAGSVTGVPVSITTPSVPVLAAERREGEAEACIGAEVPGGADVLSIRLHGAGAIPEAAQGPFSLKENILTVAEDVPVTYAQYTEFLKVLEGKVLPAVLHRIMDAVSRTVRVPVSEQLLFACHFNPEKRSIQLAEGMTVRVEEQAYKIRNESDEKFVPGYLLNETAQYTVHSYESDDGSRYFLHFDSFVDRLSGYLAFAGYDEEEGETDPAIGGLIDTFQDTRRYPFLKIQYPDGFFDSGIDTGADPRYGISFVGSSIRSRLDQPDYLDGGYYFRGRNTVSVLFKVLVNGKERLVSAGTKLHGLLAEYGCRIGNLEEISVMRRLPDIGFVDEEGKELTAAALPVAACGENSVALIDGLLLMMGDEIEFR